MNQYNPKLHHRRSIRLKGYDYSLVGLYFVTLCVNKQHCLFGDINSGEMVLNDAGMMIEKWYHELGNKFPDVRCREMVVMPNHFHCIFEIYDVGADLRICPNERVKLGEHIGSHPTIILGKHTSSPLYRVIQWFKTLSTNEYIRGVKGNNWARFDGKLGQRNYWEHIIRNSDEFYEIAGYITNNPINWQYDKLKNKHESQELE